VFKTINLYAVGVVAVLLILLPQILLYLLHTLLVLKSGGKTKNTGFYSPRSAHDISFIIPVKREPLDYVERAIRRICDLNIPGYEIIVVSDDEPAVKNTLLEITEKIRSEGCNVWFIWRSSPRGAKAGAENTGLFASRNPYVYVVDVDSYPNKCFLDIATSILESNSEYACVVGRWEPLNYESRVSAALAAGLKYMNSILYRARSKLGFYVYPLGTGTLFRSDYLKNLLRGWDEGRVLDDLEIGARIMYCGFKVAYVDDCGVYVENPSTYSAFRVQQYRWAYGALDTALTRAKYILGSKYPFLVKLEAYLYLFQYMPQVLSLTGSTMLAILQFLQPLDYVILVYPLFFIYIGVLVLYLLLLYKEIRKYAESSWSTLVLMGRLAALTNTISIYTLIGALRAIFRFKMEFKRTPKGFYQRMYSKPRIPWELILGLLFTSAAVIALFHRATLTALILLLNATSYFYVVVRFPLDVFYK